MATFEKLENNKVKVTMEISAEAFAEATQQAYLKTRAKYNVPGFRKGKAPKKMIENMYGEGAFYEDAFELAYGDVYDEAIEQLKLIPVERPEISIEKIEADEGVVFTAEFAVKPEVALGAYKGIEVVRRAYTVEEKEIDALVDAEREKLARYVEQTRPVEQGDRVILDYSGSVDGVKFDDGTAADATLDIGSGTFIPGFEEQLVGMHVGEERPIEVTFPEEYHAEALQGKKAVFEIKIKAIQMKELPEADDEFAKDISEFDTLADWRKDKRAALEKRNEERAKAEMEDEAARKATENATFDVPPPMIERQMDYMLQDIAYRLSMSGLNLEDYCKYTGTDVRLLRESYREESERRVRIQLVLEAICVAENLEATDEDIDREIEEHAERTGQNAAEVKERLNSRDKEYFKDRVLTNKTIDLLMANVKLVDEAKQKAAPKKAAKPAAEAAEKAAPKAKKAEKADAAEKPAKAEKVEKPEKKQPAEKKEAADKPKKAAKPKAEVSEEK